jgi:hypothetical protein
MKICKECFISKPIEKFPKKYDGTERRRSRCSTCYPKYKRKINPKPWKWDHKVSARKAARKKYSDMVFPCAVVPCPNLADDLHHFDYTRKLDVIPLCRPHHLDLHKK